MILSKMYTGGFLRRLFGMITFLKNSIINIRKVPRYVSVDVNVKLYVVFIFTYMDWPQEYTDTFPYPNKHLRVQSQQKKN